MDKWLDLKASSPDLSAVAQRLLARRGSEPGIPVESITVTVPDPYRNQDSIELLVLLSMDAAKIATVVTGSFSGEERGR